MKRKLFSILAAISLLLLGASCVFWIRSYSGLEVAKLCRNDEYGINSSYGEIQFEIVRRTRSPTGVLRTGGSDPMTAPGVPVTGLSWSTYYFRSFFKDDGHRWPTNAFGVGTGNDVSGITSLGSAAWRYSHYVTIRYWLLAVVFAVIPISRIALAHRMSRSKAQGLCETCGYDLRATPERCPECGAVPQRTP